MSVIYAEAILFILLSREDILAANKAAMTVPATPTGSFCTM